MRSQSKLGVRHTGRPYPVATHRTKSRVFDSEAARRGLKPGVCQNRHTRTHEHGSAPHVDNLGHCTNRVTLTSFVPDVCDVGSEDGAASTATRGNVGRVTFDPILGGHGVLVDTSGAGETV